MQSITKEYSILFNAITSVEDSLMQLRNELIAAQQLSEDIYLSEAEDESTEFFREEEC